MAAAPPLFDFALFDENKPLFTIDDIRECNPQRFEMEQLTGILHVDHEAKGLVGYKDITPNEFWVRGHMPDFPLMPGVIMCECAAQLGGFFVRKYNMLDGDFLGFGGMDEVRFRAPIMVGQRLIIMAKLDRLRPKQRAEFNFQGFVNGKLVYSGRSIGVPIHQDRQPPVAE